MKVLHLFLIIILISCKNDNVIYIDIYTDLGKIKLEIYKNKAPITTNNFLKYVDENLYTDFHFYRTVNMTNQPKNDIKIEVIQGGLGFDNPPEILPAIDHETTETTGILHKNGTISMARLEPGTASSEVFICINDQPELDYMGKRNPDGQGFAAFGKVISGMEIVLKIHSLQNTNQIIDNKVYVNSFRRTK